jgi:hypothetical protein
MDPKIWGPSFWVALHSITFDYSVNPDEEEKERIRNFFNSLEYILPCKLCRVNYSHHIRQNPIENKLNSKKDLVFWLIDIHNMVNVQNNKPKLSYQQVIDIYEKKYNKKINLNNDYDIKCNKKNGANNGANNSANNGANNSANGKNFLPVYTGNSSEKCPLNFLNISLMVILIIAILLLIMILFRKDLLKKLRVK